MINQSQRLFGIPRTWTGVREINAPDDMHLLSGTRDLFRTVSGEIIMPICLELMCTLSSESTSDNSASDGLGVVIPT